ncbi:hypothetical protein [Saccharopolyspora sp. 5N708]|uniref:hypothetical protein n=1 Tax=Saccharopolyspora sp. 5N708 TaxID=3457424 RepID=UPI003FD05938
MSGWVCGMVGRPDGVAEVAVAAGIPSDSEAMLRQLEVEMSAARSYVLQRRAAGDERAAQLHVVWIDLLLDEWIRCRLPAHVADQGRSGVEMA